MNQSEKRRAESVMNQSEERRAESVMNQSEERRAESVINQSASPAVAASAAKEGIALRYPINEKGEGLSR